MTTNKSTLDFDREAFFNRMTNAGMSPELAHAQAEMLAAIQDDLVQNWLATKSELKRTDTRLTREIALMGSKVIFRLGSLIFAGFMIVMMAQLLKLFA